MVTLTINNRKITTAPGTSILDAATAAGEKKKAHYIVDEKCIRCGTCRDVCRFDSVLVS